MQCRPLGLVASNSTYDIALDRIEAAKDRVIVDEIVKFLEETWSDLDTAWVSGGCWESSVSSSMIQPSSEACMTGGDIHALAIATI